MFTNLSFDSKTQKKRLAHKLRSNLLSQRLKWAFYFFVINLFLVNIIAISYVNFAIIPESWLGISFYITNSLSHFSFLTLLVFIVLVIPLAILFKNIDTFIKLTVSILGISYTIFAFDIQISKNFNFHFSPLVASSFFSIGSYIDVSYYWSKLYLVYPVSILVLTIIGFILKDKLHRMSSLLAPIKILLAILLGCFIFSHMMFAYADFKNIYQITSQKYNFPLNYPLTARDFLQNIDVKPQADSDFDSYPLVQPNYKLVDTKPNILIINSNLVDHDQIKYLVSSFKHTEYRNIYANSDNITNSVRTMLFGIDARYARQLELTKPLIISRTEELGYKNYLVNYPNINLSTYMIKKSSLDFNDIETPWFAMVNMHDASFKSLQMLFSSLSNSEKKTIVVITNLYAKFLQVLPNFNKPIKNQAYLIEINTPPEKIIDNNLASNIDFIPSILKNYLGFDGRIKQFFTGGLLNSHNESSSPNQDWVMVQQGSDFHLLTSEYDYLIDRNRDFKTYDLQSYQLVNQSPRLSLLTKVYGKNFSLFKYN